MLAFVGLLLTAQTGIAKATNEHDYRIGLKYGHEEYHQCYTTHSCDASENYWSLGCDESFKFPDQGAFKKIDNETACQHGYTHGWIQECLLDGGSGSGACKPQPDPTKYTYAKCIASGHDWDAGQCLSGKLVAITGPTVCHQTSEGQTCESGSVPGSGWIPVKYINHTAPDPGCTRLTDHPNYESCVDVTNTNVTKDNETNTNATENMTPPSSPYSAGFAAGKRDAKTNLYDSTNACNDYNTINNTAAQAYACLKGYENGDTSRYHSGYLQGVQGAELKGTHTQGFMKGYFKGIQGYWWNRGLVEGYSGLPASMQNANYTAAYKSEHAEYAAGYPTAKNCGIDLGKLPAHTNDSYRDFYLGLDQGGDAYGIVDGAHYFLYNGPPGHTAEYYAGWKFGYSLGLAFDSDCG